MINGSGKIKQHTKLSSLYRDANTNMTGARIVCPVYTVNLDGARSDLVALWLARLTLEPADPGRFLCGHLLYIFYLFFSL